MYISNTNNDGHGHSLSQSLDYQLDNGKDISNDSSLPCTDEVMHSASHALGKDISLQRGAHDEVLKLLGVNNYSKMSESQLQASNRMFQLHMMLRRIHASHRKVEAVYQVEEK